MPNDIGSLVIDHGDGASVGGAQTRTRWVNRHPEEYHKGTYSETLRPIAENYFYDDFDGYFLDDYVAGTNSGGVWFKQIVGAAPPTILNIGAPACGWVQCHLTGANQAQTALLDCANRRIWAIAYGLQFEAKVLMLTALPTGVAEGWIGVAGDYLAGPLTGAGGGPLEHAFFHVAAVTGAVSVYTDDTSVAGDLAVATGISMVAGVGHVFRIDFTNPASVRFYIDGTRVCAATTFNLNTVPALVVQPMFGMFKAATADTGDMIIDYVRIWQERY